MKQVSGTLKLDLAQFRELEAFATFGSELDKVSQAQLDRGYRLTELLKQPQNRPVPVEEQVLAIYAGTKGWTDTVPVSEVRRFETELIEYFKGNHPIVLETIRATGALPDGDELDKGLTVVPRGLRHGEGRLTHGRRPGAGSCAAASAASSRRGRSPRRWSSSPPRGSSAPSTRIVANRPFREGMERVLRLSRGRPIRPRRSGSSAHPRSPRQVGILAVAGDRGLAGSYNSAVLRATERLVTEHRSNGAQVTGVVGGQEGGLPTSATAASTRRDRSSASPTAPSSPTPGASSAVVAAPFAVG